MENVCVYHVSSFNKSCFSDSAAVPICPLFSSLWNFVESD